MAKSNRKPNRKRRSPVSEHCRPDFVATLRSPCSECREKGCCPDVRVFVPTRDFHVCWRRFTFLAEEAGLSHRVREGFLVHLLQAQAFGGSAGCVWATALSDGLLHNERAFLGCAIRLLRLTGVCVDFEDGSLFDFESYVADCYEFAHDRRPSRPEESDYLGVPLAPSVHVLASG